MDVLSRHSSISSRKSKQTSKFNKHGRVHKVSPMESSAVGNFSSLSMEELLDKYTFVLPNKDIILDTSKLPSTETLKGSKILQRHDVQQIFAQTVTKCLTDIDNTLDSILEDSWEAFKPFVPIRVFHSAFSLKSGSPEKFNPETEIITEVRVFGSILNQSNGAIDWLRCHQTTDSLRLLKQLINDRISAFGRVKKTIQNFKAQFSRKYQASYKSARLIYKDFDIFRGNIVSTNSVYKRQPTNSLTLCAQASGVSILCKSNGKGTPEWKRCSAGDSCIRQTLIDLSLEEIKDRVLLALTVLKGSLNRVNLVLQDSSGEGHICLEFEMKKLNRLFAFGNMVLHRSGSAAIIFFFMRILAKIKKLEKVLKTTLKFIKITRKEFSLKSDLIVSLPKKASVQIDLETYTERGRQADIFCTEFKRPCSRFDPFVIDTDVDSKEGTESTDLLTTTASEDEEGNLEWNSTSGTVSDDKCQICINEERKNLSAIQAY